MQSYFDFWGEKLKALKDTVSNAYKNATEPISVDIPGVPRPSTPQAVSKPVVTLQDIQNVQGNNTPSAYPTLSPDYAFTTHEKPNLPSRLIDTVNTAATNVGLNPKVLASVPAQETGGYGYQPVQGTSGERGITQIIPAYYYKEAGYKTPEEYGLALESNDDFAIKETARILKRNYKGQQSIFDALRQYNAGGNLQNGTQYAIQVLKRVGLEDEIPEEYKGL